MSHNTNEPFGKITKGQYASLSTYGAHSKKQQIQPPVLSKLHHPSWDYMRPHKVPQHYPNEHPVLKRQT